MHSPRGARTRTAIDTAALEIRVCSAECDPLSDADIRRLFAGSSLTAPRLDRLRAWPRVSVLLDGRIVALATCLKYDAELRVPDVAVDEATGPLSLADHCLRCGERDMINALLDAIEMACLAEGCSRVIVSPPKTSMAFLQRRGYTRVDETCAGGWIEKTIA